MTIDLNLGLFFRKNLFDLFFRLGRLMLTPWNEKGGHSPDPPDPLEVVANYRSVILLEYRIKVVKGQITIREWPLFESIRGVVFSCDFLSDFEKTTVRVFVYL